MPQFLLEKFSGKGGWTYVLLPDIAPNASNPFGWVIVNGFIDHVELKNHKLMPFGNGQVFLPVNAKLRKQLNKQAGDRVELRLEVLTSSELSSEFLSCLEDYPTEHQKFKTSSLEVQEKILQYIYSAKNADERVTRMAEILDQLST